MDASTELKGSPGDTSQTFSDLSNPSREIRKSHVDHLTLEAASEGHIVDWDGPSDLDNPQNWSKTKRWSIVILISVITSNQAMSSTIFAPGVPHVMTQFRETNQAISSLLVSIYVLGLLLGPLFLSPLSETYGRVPLMHITNCAFCISAILCAVSVDIPMLLAFRLVLGACTISLGGGYVADLMKPESRGRAMNVWTIGPVLAPIVGPIVGGFICLKTSWRWTFALVAISGALLTVVCFLILPETYPPRLLQLKAKRLRKHTGNASFHSKYDGKQTASQLFRRSIIRPMRMLCFCPIVGILSLFLAIAYSYMYLLFTTFTQVFETTYGFNSGEAGLVYLGLGIGSLIGQYGMDFYMKWCRRQRRSKDQASEPEDHLPPLVAAGTLLAGGLLWYGWAAEYQIHWIVPILGTGMCGIGIAPFFLSVQVYLVEAYVLYSASALAASSAIRCIFGLTIPLAAPSLYEHLGFGWGNTLLAGLALMVALASIWLIKYGKEVREDSRFQPDL